MSKKTELERIIEYGISGVPELKAEEKRKWLGEFRERVILGLRRDQVTEIGAFNVVKEALRDSEAGMIIVNNNVPMDVNARYMGLAKEMKKDYKSVASNYDQAMGLVVAGLGPVNRSNVIPEVQTLPDKFRDAKYKEICPECYEELHNIDPDMAKKFKKLNFIDKILGIYCGACGKGIK